MDVLLSESPQVCASKTTSLLKEQRWMRDRQSRREESERVSLLTQRSLDQLSSPTCSPTPGVGLPRGHRSLHQGTQNALPLGPVEPRVVVSNPSVHRLGRQSSVPGGSGGSSRNTTHRTASSVLLNITVDQSAKSPKSAWIPLVPTSQALWLHRRFEVSVIRSSVNLDPTC